MLRQAVVTAAVVPSAVAAAAAPAAGGVSPAVDVSAVGQLSAGLPAASCTVSLMSGLQRELKKYIEMSTQTFN